MWDLHCSDTCFTLTAPDPDGKLPGRLGLLQVDLKNTSLRFREDAASSSTFTLEDSAICLTSEHSTVDVDIDRDDGSVLDVYLVSALSWLVPIWA